MALLQKLAWTLDGGPLSSSRAVCIRECQPNRPCYIPNPERIASLSPALDRRGRKGEAVQRWENAEESPSTLNAVAPAPESPNLTVSCGLPDACRCLPSQLLDFPGQPLRLLLQFTMLRTPHPRAPAARWNSVEQFGLA